MSDRFPSEVVAKVHRSTKQCERCGEEFVDETYSNTKKFCSYTCRYNHRRETAEVIEERECEVCGDSFVATERRDTETCSEECGQELAAERRKAAV